MICSLSIFIFLIISSIYSVQAHPGEEGDCEEGHNPGPYAISSPQPNTLFIGPEENFMISINGTGPSVIVNFNPITRDNANFTASPQGEIPDNSLHDLSPLSHQVLVNYTLMSPPIEGNYTILFYARSPTENPTRVAGMTFHVIVNKIYAQNPHWYEDIVQMPWFRHLFNHYNIYIGGTAILLLSIGTILFEINHKYIKIHGILAASALVLTTLNIVLIFSQSWRLLLSWFVGEPLEWWHALHLLTGIAGWICGVVGMLQGIGGHNMKKLGYFALFLWIFNFGFGLLYWGISW